MKHLKLALPSGARLASLLLFLLAIAFLWLPWFGAKSTDGSIMWRFSGYTTINSYKMVAGPVMWMLGLSGTACLMSLIWWRWGYGLRALLGLAAFAATITFQHVLAHAAIWMGTPADYDGTLVLLGWWVTLAILATATIWNAVYFGIGLRHRRSVFAASAEG